MWRCFVFGPRTDRRLVFGTCTRFLTPIRVFALLIYFYCPNDDTERSPQPRIWRKSHSTPVMVAYFSFKSLSRPTFPRAPVKIRPLNSVPACPNKTSLIPLKSSNVFANTISLDLINPKTKYSLRTSRNLITNKPAGWISIFQLWPGWGDGWLSKRVSRNAPLTFSCRVISPVVRYKTNTACVYISQESAPFVYGEKWFCGAIFLNKENKNDRKCRLMCIKMQVKFEQFQGVKSKQNMHILTKTSFLVLQILFNAHVQWKVDFKRLLCDL